MLSFPNSSLILLVAHSIYKTFVENKMTQNMLPKHLMQKYHIGLSFQGLEVVATTKSPTLQVRHVKRKFNTPKPHIHKMRAGDWSIA
jgi:hypothetical protein